MQAETKTKTQQILSIMTVLAWIAFIGLMIEAGAILVSYVVSYFTPEAARNVYNGMNFYELRQFSFYYYSLSVSFMMALSAMKAYIAFLLINALSKVNLRNPFTLEVAQKLETISHVLLGIWIVSILNNAHSAWVVKRLGVAQTEVGTGEFLFIAGLVFIISQIFKRGVELQAENELTV